MTEAEPNASPAAPARTPPRPAALREDGDRLRSLDLLRLLAIGCMILAHWQGVLKGLPQPVTAPLFWCMRFATPAFVTIFGLILGYVFWERYVQVGAALNARFYRRARLTFLYALLVAFPKYAELVWASDWSLFSWVFGSYSILLFYALAVLGVPLYFRLIRRSPKALSFGIGALLWAAATVIRPHWPPNPNAWLELPRFLLVSGDYSYLNMMGWALMVLPIGIFARERIVAGRKADLLGIAAVGACAAIASLLPASFLPDFSIESVLTGEAKYPPRIWYFAHFSGLSLLLFGVLGWIEVGKGVLPAWTAPLESLAKRPLVVYTAHAYVLPLTHLLAWATGASTKITFAISLVAFLAFCYALIEPRRASAGKGPASPPAGGDVSCAEAPAPPARGRTSVHD